jgi:hypothetical protein
LFNNVFSINRAVCEKKSKHIVEPVRPQMIMWRFRIAGWRSKATITHSQEVILFAFLLQQWLHEGNSILLYTYTAYFITIRCMFQNKDSSTDENYTYKTKKHGHLFSFCFSYKNDLLLRFVTQNKN